MNTDCYAPLAIVQALSSSDSLSAICMATLKSEATRSHSSIGFYLLIFSLTCLFEAPVYFGIGKILKRPSKELLKQTFLLNLATHPIVFWLVPLLMEATKQNTLTMVVVGESFAPIIEALLLLYWAKYSWKMALLASLTANLFSWWVGLFLMGQGII